MNQELIETCSLCDNLALCICFECSFKMCESCAIHHIKSEGLLTHQICNTASLTQITEPKQKMCLEHNELLTLFCNECERFICQNCKLSNNHSEHTFTNVDVMVSERKEKLKHLVEEAEKKKKTIESITVDAETALELIKITNQKNIAYVEEKFQLIFETLNTQRLNITKVINDKYAESVNSINQAKGHNKVLSHCINFTNDVIESKYTTEIIDNFENLKRQLQDISSLTLKLKRASPSQLSSQSTSQSARAEDLGKQLENAENSAKENKEQKEIKDKSGKEKENRNSYNGFQTEPSDKIRQRLLSAPAISFSKKKDKEQKIIGENSTRSPKKKFRIPLVKSFGFNKNKNALEISNAKQMPAEKNSTSFEKTPPPRPPPAKLSPVKNSQSFKQSNETPPPRPTNPPHKAVCSSNPPIKPPAPKCLTSMETNRDKSDNSQHETLTSASSKSPSPTYSENNQVKNTALTETPIIKTENSNDNSQDTSLTVENEFNFDQNSIEMIKGPDYNESESQELVKSNDQSDESIESLYAKVNKRKKSNEEQKSHSECNKNESNDLASNTKDSTTENVGCITNNSDSVIILEQAKSVDHFLSESSEHHLYAKINEVIKPNQEQEIHSNDIIENEKSSSNEIFKNSSIAFDKPVLSYKSAPEKPQRPRYVAGIELNQVELVLNDKVLHSVIKYLDQACSVIMQNQASENSLHIFSLKDDVIYM